MKIVCKSMEEYADMLRRCLDNWADDNCKCCVLRNLCGQRKEAPDADIAVFLELKAE